MDEKEYELLREVREMVWELRVWAREGADGKSITDKIWKELVERIEELERRGG